MRRAALALALLLPACALAVPTPTPTQQAASVAPLVLPPAPTRTPPAASTVPAQATAPAVPTRALVPTAAPVDPTHGVAFGRPAALVSGNGRVVGVLVTNRTDLAKSFLVRGAYLDGDRVAATATGTVADLLPGQTRAVVLLEQGPPPPGQLALRLGVESVIDLPARAAPLIRFGPATVATAPSPRVDVLVTNDDAAAHSFIAQAALVLGDDLVGVGTAAVTDLAPGESRPATMLVRGGVAGYDRVLLAVDTLAH